MVQVRVPVVMCLAGPDNALPGRFVAPARVRGTVVVAAVGNERRAACDRASDTADGAGSLTGAASGSGSASGSSLGQGALSRMGSGAISAFNPGQTVRDAKGEAIAAFSRSAGALPAGWNR